MIIGNRDMEGLSWFLGSNWLMTKYVPLRLSPVVSYHPNISVSPTHHPRQDTVSKPEPRRERTGKRKKELFQEEEERANKPRKYTTSSTPKDVT
jgi:hypothetical protein